MSKNRTGDTPPFHPADVVSFAPKSLEMYPVRRSLSGPITEMEVPVDVEKMGFEFVYAELLRYVQNLEMIQRIILTKEKVEREGSRHDLILQMIDGYEQQILNLQEKNLKIQKRLNIGDKMKVAVDLTLEIYYIEHAPKLKKEMEDIFRQMFAIEKEKGMDIAKNNLAWVSLRSRLKSVGEDLSLLEKITKSERLKKIRTKPEVETELRGLFNGKVEIASDVFDEEIYSVASELFKKLDMIDKKSESEAKALSSVRKFLVETIKSINLFLCRIRQINNGTVAGKVELLENRVQELIKKAQEKTKDIQ